MRPAPRLRAKTRISAIVDPSTKSRLARFARRSGSSQAQVIEQALLHVLSTCSHERADAILPVRIVVSRNSALEIAARIAARPAPTAEMWSLFHEE